MPGDAGLLGASRAGRGCSSAALVFGWLTDRIGRRRFLLALLASYVLSLAQLAVTDAIWLAG